MNRDTVIAVLAALKREISPFLGLMDKVTRKRQSGCTVWEGLFYGVKVRVITTGMAAEPSIDLLHGCRALLSTGFCGALSGNVHTGDMVVSSSVAYADRDLIHRILNPESTTGSYDGSGIFDIHVDDELLTAVQDNYNIERSTIHTGRTVTGARVIRNSEEKNRIGSYFDALSIDMEDYGRLRIARQLQTPMWCFRAVLDDVEDTVLGPWSGMGSGKLSKLLGKISPAQQGICRMLTNLVPAMENT